MPRPGPRRRSFTLRLSEAGLAAVERHAARETDDNLSEMIRKLLGEALAEREKRTRER